jgi:hypothetical protein
MWKGKCLRRPSLLGAPAVGLVGSGRWVRLGDLDATSSLRSEGVRLRCAPPDPLTLGWVVCFEPDTNEAVSGSGVAKRSLTPCERSEQGCCGDVLDDPDQDTPSH